MIKNNFKTIVMLICTILVSTNFLAPIASANEIENKIEKKAEMELRDIIKAEYSLEESEITPFISDMEEASKYYIYDVNGDLIYNAEGALANNVDSVIVAEITNDISKLNDLKTQEIEEANISNDLQIAYNVKAATKAKCKGLNFVNSPLKKYYINSCNSVDLAYFYTIAAAVITLVSFILSIINTTAAVATLIAATISAVGAASLSYYNKKGCGVWGYYSKNNPTMKAQTCTG